MVAGDKLGGNDEAITIRTFANNVDDWILGYLASEEVQDAKGKRFKLTRNYYDGTEFQGLPVGQVARGDLSRTESWISGDSFVNETANQFDSDGNVTANIKRSDFGLTKYIPVVSDEVSISVPVDAYKD